MSGRKEWAASGGTLAAWMRCREAPAIRPTVGAPYLNGASTSMRQAEHGCRILDGVVTCFGANDSGQLGTGKTEPFSPPAVVDLGL